MVLLLERNGERIFCKCIVLETEIIEFSETENITRQMIRKYPTSGYKRRIKYDVI